MLGLKVCCVELIGDFSVQLVPNLTPPCDVKFIVLSGLDASAIYLTMQQTNIKRDVTILDYLKIPTQHVKFFCEELHKHSGGLPIIVHKALEGTQTECFNLSGLCATNPSLKTQADIVEALEVTAYRYIVSLRAEEVFVKKAILTGPLYEYYLAFLMMSLLRIPVQKDELVKIGTSDVPILELVNRLDLFIEPTAHEDEFTINFSQYVSRNLLDQLKVLRTESLSQ